ncbi:sigma-70 family RNA polymerase sigma factor [Patescibacteria group bacterium]|nr:sigma-70 family RNA polymerase sigma factor [Patescibacteria group bacterium]
MSNELDKKTDGELVSLVLENSDYFLYLVRRYEQKLTRYIARISNLDKDDIEDVLQDIFIKVYKNLNGFDTSLKFSSWIYRITHNEVISNYRKFKNKAQNHSNFYKLL